MVTWRSLKDTWEEKKNGWEYLLKNLHEDNKKMGRLTRLRKTNNEVFYKFIVTRKTDLDQAAKNKIIAEVNNQIRLTKPVVQSLYNKYRDAEEKIVSERNIFKKTFYYLKR